MSSAGGGSRTILFLHPSAGGYGADRQLQVLATGLDPSRYRPLVVLPEPGELGPRLEQAGVEVVIADLAVLRRGLLRGRALRTTLRMARRNARELGELARARDVALIHTNSTIVLAGQAVARQARRPHLLHVREIYTGAAGLVGDALWLPFRFRLARADALACVSEAARRPFAGVDHAFVLHDALARELVLPAREVARQSLGIDRGSFVVAVVGRISDWKGQEVLVRALGERALRGLDLIVLFAGDSAPDQRHFTERLEAIARELGVADRIRLLGYREDVETVLAAADAVAHPSTHPDALPNTLIEAAAAGLPVVATSTGGQTEIVREGVTGLLAAPGDAPGLATTLREIADDPALARRLGEAAAVDARRRFGRASMLEKLQDSYDRLCEAARPVAWLLPSKRMPVSQTAAPDVRLARFESSFRALGYRPVVLPPPGLRNAPGLVMRALRERPGLVFTNAAVNAPALAGIKRLLGERVLAHVDVMGLHSLEVEQAHPHSLARPLLARIWSVLEGLACRSADVVSTVNDRHTSLVRRRYRAVGPRTLRDAAEPELATIAPMDRARLGIPADAIVVGYVGSIVYSRLDPLFAAWRELEAGADVHLLIIGDGPDLERYRREVRTSRRSAQVVFVGALPRDEAHAALRACDVAFSDCWSEAGFPFKLFEYMALGLPIVTEGKPQTSEVLTDEHDALFFSMPAELADRLRRLVRDPELRARLGSEARRTFLAAHTLEHRERELARILRDEPEPAKPEHRWPPELVSVVLPVRNGEAHLEEQLAALAAQTYAAAWELVVVDNGCTDRSIAIAESWRGRLPSLAIVDARDRRGVNHARRYGVEAARGELLAFCDADDVATPTWLEKLVLASANADMVGGNRDDEALNGKVVRAWRPRTTRVKLPVKDAFLPIVDGGNCAIWKRVAQDVDWDESFKHGGSDVEFSWRVQLAGYGVEFAPQAVMKIRYRESMLATARQYFGYGSADPRRYRRFRRFGMPRSRLRDAARSWWWLLRHSPDLLRSIERRGNWLRHAAHDAGRLVGSIRSGVLYLAPPRHSGLHLLEFGVRWPPETYISHKLERLVAAGFRVTVAAFSDSPEGRTAPSGVERVPVLRDGGRPVRALARVAVSFVRLLFSAPGRMLVVARAARMPTAAGRTVDHREALLRFAAYARLAALRPDIVHFEWATTAAHFLSLVDALGCPYVVSCHGGDTQIQTRTPSGLAAAAAYPEIYRRAAAVHSVADAVTKDASRFGLAAEKTSLIRAGVDAGFFHPGQRSHDANGSFPILAVGTLRWLKGFEYALLAVAELARQGVPASLDIVGGDPEWDEPSERERLLETITALGLADRMRVHGRVYPREVRDRLRNAGAYLQSSFSEGHPTAVVEAMACGVPVVATDCGGTREAVNHGVEGFLVPPRDWRAAAAALRSLWEDPALRSRMGEAGRSRVESEFTLDRQSEEFLRFYEQVGQRCS